jgi:hypothetical protein
MPRPFPRKGAWCKLRDGRLAVITEFPCLDRGYKDDVDDDGRPVRRAMLTPNNKRACITLVTPETGTLTTHRRAVPVTELRKVKRGDVPIEWLSGPERLRAMQQGGDADAD